MQREIKTVTIGGVNYDVESLNPDQQGMVDMFVEWQTELNRLKKEATMRQLAIDGLVKALEDSVLASPPN